MHLERKDILEQSSLVLNLLCLSSDAYATCVVQKRFSESNSDVRRRMPSYFTGRQLSVTHMPITQCC